MNFVEFASSRVAVHVRKEDYDMFARLCDEHGFTDLFGDPMTRHQYPEYFWNQMCLTHGYHGRPLNRHLSNGRMDTYIQTAFPVVEFTSFDEYTLGISEHTATSFPTDDLLSLLQ